MKIGICSPFMPHDLEDLLDQRSKGLLPLIKGVTATPVTPLVREWHRLGHTVSVFCLDPSASEPMHLTGERLSIDVLPKRRFRHSALDFYAKERRLIREAVSRRSPEVLSAQWSYEHSLAALDTGLPVAVTCHDTPLRYAWISKSFFMSFHVLVAAQVIRKADRLICVSPYTAKHISRYFQHKVSPTVIPNGISRKLLLRGGRRLARPPGNDRVFTFCSIGGWGGIKNTKPLLVAYSRIRLSGRPTRLVMFGNGLGAEQEAQKWAESRDLAKGVEFRGSTPHPQILDFLENEADTMVHPSVVETHGMVFIEAMACGVPVIGGESSGAVPWTLGHGDYGYLCDVRSPKALEKTMISAMQETEKTRSMAKAAWDAFAHRFVMEDAASANLDVLSGLASKKGG